MNIEQVEKFWDNSDKNFSHLTIPNWLINRWEKYFLNKIDFNNKSVIDYGIGGGYLGKLLFDEYNLQKYVGIDISQRQLDHAKKYLKNTNSYFYKTPIQFNKLNADIFISQAVIQHFPNEEYLVDFLKNINFSNCEFIMLQIRHNKETKFSENYKKISDVAFACQTNHEYIVNYLYNYKLDFSSEILKDNKYQFLIYKKK